MNNENKIDDLCYYILNTIDINVLKSLSPAQLSSIDIATKACQLRSKHTIDIRGKINLFFLSFYFGFFMGRDNRLFIQEIEGERREKVSLLGNIFYFIYLLLGVIVLIFFIIWLIMMTLYILKTGMGIDIYPGKHMGGIFGF